MPVYYRSFGNVNPKEVIMAGTAVIVFSDPKSGGDEALGRLFNALFLTLELKEKGEDVALAFQGAGARWPEELVKPGHPANALFHAVQDKVDGVCGGCADVFGATSASSCRRHAARLASKPGPALNESFQKRRRI